MRNKTVYEPYDRSLTASGSSAQEHGLALSYLKGDVVKEPLGGTFITE